MKPEQETVVPPKSNSPAAPFIKRYPREDGSTYFIVMISGCIDQSATYVELVHELYNASVADKFDIIIQSCGGYVSGGNIVANAISDTLADVTTIANGLCASAATTIWMSSDNMEVRDWANIMFHMSSHGGGGNSVAIKEKAEDLIEFIKYLLDMAISKKLLTTEEYTAIVEHKKDVYIPVDEMRSRLGGK